MIKWNMMLPRSTARDEVIAARIYNGLARHWNMDLWCYGGSVYVAHERCLLANALMRMSEKGIAQRLARFSPADAEETIRQNVQESLARLCGK